MKSTRTVFVGLLVLICVVVVLKCGGGSGALVVDSLDDTLAANTSDYDFSVSGLSTAQILLRDDMATVSASMKQTAKSVEEEGEFSRIGCEAGMMQANAEKISQSVAAMNCRFKVMADAIEQFVINSEWSYYHLVFPDDFKQEGGCPEGEECEGGTGGEHYSKEGGSHAIKMRIKETAGGFAFDICEKRYGQTAFEQNESSTWSAEAGTLQAAIQFSFKETLPDMEGYGGEQFPGGELVFQNSMNLNVTEPADGATHDYDFGEAKITATFADKFTPTGGEEGFGRAGLIEFEADAEKEWNTIKFGFKDGVSGGSNGEHNFSHRGVAMWDKETGTGLYTGGGTFPAFQCPEGDGMTTSDFCCCIFNEEEHQCDLTKVVEPACTEEFSDTESFAITVTKKDDGSIKKAFTKIDHSKSATYETVVAMDKPEVPATPTVEFDRVWPCDGEFVTITLTDVFSDETHGKAMQVCDKLEGGFHSGDGNQCWNQEGKAGEGEGGPGPE